MNKNALIIFLTEYQLEYLLKADICYKTIYVIMRNDQFKQVNIMNKQITILSKEIDKNSLINLLGQEVDVLCCHEEGLYWLKQKGCMQWNYQFSNNIFNILVKHKFKDFLTINNINNAQYYTNAEHIETYPIIAKPAIGFGSICVKYLKDKVSLDAYLHEYQKAIYNSGIRIYQDKYFPYDENICILENYVSGSFYRTAFIVSDDKTKWIFPVRGKNTTQKESSDFHWTDFEYGENERLVSLKLRPILEKLIPIFQLKNGVYVAEFIITDSEEIFLLEFSPRQISDRIAKIIQLSSGIDIEKCVIDIFLNKISIDIDTNNKDIRLRIERDNSDIPVPDDYVIVEENEEKSVYGDKIKSVYYEKR